MLLYALQSLDPLLLKFIVLLVSISLVQDVLLENLDELLDLRCSVHYWVLKNLLTFVEGLLR